MIRLVTTFLSAFLGCLFLDMSFENISNIFGAYAYSNIQPKGHFPVTSAALICTIFSMMFFRSCIGTVINRVLIDAHLSRDPDYSRTRLYRSSQGGTILAIPSDFLEKSIKLGPVIGAYLVCFIGLLALLCFIFEPSDYFQDNRMGLAIFFIYMPTCLIPSAISMWFEYRSFNNWRSFFQTNLVDEVIF